MLSLSNAFSEEDLVNFEKKIKNYLDLANDFKIEYSTEPKIDGISASLTYINGKLIKGLSRGDGNEGLYPTVKFGESLLLRKIFFFSNSSISFFKLSNS